MSLVDSPTYHHTHSHQHQHQNQSLSANRSLTCTHSANESCILVNVKELNVRLYSEIIVSWSIVEDTSMHDWLGIYHLSMKIAIKSPINHPVVNIFAIVFQAT